MPISENMIIKLGGLITSIPFGQACDLARAVIAELEKTHEIVERRQQDEERRNHQERLLEASLYRLNDIIKNARD